MPRMALDDTLAAVWTGRPIRCLEPAPITSRGVLAALASASTRASSRSSMGRIWEWTATAASRSLGPKIAAIERKHLVRVEQPLRVEHGLEAHLQPQVGLAELHAHEVALLEAHAVLAREAAAHVDAQLEDLGARLLGSLGLGRIVGVVEDERMQVAVAGVEDVGHPETVVVADVRNLDQHLAEAPERDNAVHAVVVGDAADGAERRLAPLPDGRALLGALADADRAGMEPLGDVRHRGEEVG